MYKVLLIDDDETMHALMERVLVEGGYDYLGARNGQEGLKLLAREKPDLLLLDIMLPGVNGYTVCQQVRDEGRRIPIILISAKNDIVDKSIGFGAGADDYVTKPFNAEELLLRIGAQLRRHKSDLAAAKAVSRGGSARIGDVEVFFNRYEVRVRGKKLEMTSKEFEILALLAASPGQVFTRTQIAEHIWGEADAVDGNSITVFIRKIREKIEDNPSQPRYLLTVWRVGYKFTDEVS